MATRKRNTRIDKTHLDFRQFATTDLLTVQQVVDIAAPLVRDKHDRLADAKDRVRHFLMYRVRSGYLHVAGDKLNSGDVAFALSEKWPGKFEGWKRNIPADARSALGVSTKLVGVPFPADRQELLERLFASEQARESLEHALKTSLTRRQSEVGSKGGRPKKPFARKTEK